MAELPKEEEMFSGQSQPSGLRGFPLRPVVLGVFLSLLLSILVPSLTLAGHLDPTWYAPTTNTDGSPLTNLASYRVYSGTSSAGCPGAAYQTVASTTSAPSAGTVVSYTLPGLTAGTTYFVQVTAVDSSSIESACSSAASGAAKADASDTTPPTGTLTINNGALYTPWTAVTVGLAATDNVGVTGYYLATSATPPAATAPGWVAITATPSYSNSNVLYTLASGDGLKTVYAWYKDAAGNLSSTASATIRLDQTPPSNGTLSATAGSAQVAVSWAGFTDSGSGLATTNTYKLMFTPGTTPPAACTSGTQIYQGTGTTYTHTGLTNGTSYAYRVCATDKAGNISTGASAMATPQGTDTIPPTVSITAPTSAATYSTSGSTLSLGGTAGDNVGVSAITWANSRGGSGTASGTTSWTVSGLALQSGTNVLTVSAKDAAGNTGTATLTVTYTAPDTTPPTVSLTTPTTGAAVSGTSTVSANAADNVGVVGVQFKLDGANLGTEVTVAPYATAWNTATATNASHTLTAVARDAAGNSTTSAAVAVTVSNRDTQAPSVPTGLTATAVSSTQVTLAWAASTDNVGVNGYQIFRGGTQVGTTPTTTYTNTGLAAGTTYTYTVAAYDAAGNTSALSTVTATTTLPDTTPPTVRFTAPTTGATYSTSSRSINLVGTAADNVGVTSVTWTNSRGGSGTASGTTNWAVSGIALKSGNNVLTVTARDAAGNTGTATLTVK